MNGEGTSEHYKPKQLPVQQDVRLDYEPDRIDASAVLAFLALVVCGLAFGALLAAAMFGVL